MAEAAAGGPSGGFNPPGSAPYCCHELLALAGFLLIPLLLIVAAVLDGKHRFGWWFKRKSRATMEAPLPFEHLSAADPDAWFGGDGGA